MRSERRGQVEDQSGCAGMKMAQPGQHGDKNFQEAAQFRGPGQEPVSRCVFAAWEGGGVAVFPVL